MSIDSDVDPSEVSTAKRKPSRSWLLIDAAGNSTMLNVDSYAIIRRVHIYARDLRVFESSISSPLSIRTREGAIVLNLEVRPFLFLSFFFIHYWVFSNVLIIFGIALWSDEAY
jgi:hypothetical protein